MGTLSKHPSANHAQVGRTLHDLTIEHVYRAAAGEVPWADVLAAVARVHGADQAMFVTPSRSENDGGIRASFSAISESQERIVDGAVHGGPAAFLQHERAHAEMVGDGGMIPPGLLVLFRAESREPFDRAERAGIEHTCRHLAIALRVWFLKRESARGAEAVAAHVDAAFLMLDPSGAVLWMNPRAERWVRAGRIVVTDGRLVDVADFALDFAQALRAAANGTPWIGMGEAQRASMEIMGANGEGSGKRVLLSIRDHSLRLVITEVLARHFQLTPSEVDLAVAIAAGTRAAEYAAQRGVSMSTVRSQLRSLFAKTGARTQGDVISLVLRLRPLFDLRRGSFPPPES